MTTSGNIREAGFLPDRHRFFDDLVGMVMSITSYLYAMRVFKMTSMPINFEDRTLQDWMRAIWPLRSPELSLRFPRNTMNDVIAFLPGWDAISLSDGGWPIQMLFRIEIPGLSGPTWVSEQGLKNPFIERATAAAFVSFFARVEGDLVWQYGEKRTWPDDLKFANAVRNGFAHGDAFHLTGNVTQMSWRGLNLDASWHAKRVLHEPDSLALGDVVLLMEDVNSRL